MKLAIIIPIFNRPAYVAKCFKSLESADIPRGTLMILVDDASTEELPVLGIPHELVRHNKNTCVKGALLTGMKRAIDAGCDMFMNLDSDAIVKPEFINRLIGVYKETGESYIISGFNNNNEPKLSTYDGYCVKRHANGINMLFNYQSYEAFIKPSLKNGEGNWDFEASERSHEVIIAIPSVVQHIGLISSMGHAGADVAQDFKQLHLPDVTLFGIDSHNPAGLQRAASISQRDITFGAVNIITEDLFTKGANRDVRIRDYSRFMIKELTNHFGTSHVLTIHADGYVVNWEAWDSDWLQYDYIGATWSYKDGMNVGNGGFSLRSKKLCEILAEYELEHTHPEDHCICRVYRAALEKLGIRFASEEVANKFSIEAYGSQVFPGGNEYSGQFGFHGPHVTGVPNGLEKAPVKVSARRIK